MEALARIDRTTIFAGRRFGLRDAAVLALLQAGIARRDLTRLRCTNLRQDEHSGHLYVRRQQDQRTVYVRLNTDQTGLLLEYLEYSRRWCGEADQLFSGRAGQPLTLRGLKAIETKHRRRR